MIAPPLFLYGTLLDPAVLARQAGRRGLDRRLVPARLAGWRRVFLRGAPYPTLLRARGAVTPGALLAVGPRVLARLAAYEGALYRLRPLRVRARRGSIAARAWIAPGRLAAAARPWPVTAPPATGRAGVLTPPA